jgi:hypothetical protein
MAKGVKTGGREQGTPNRLTKELRIILKNIVAKEIENIPSTLEKLEPKDRLDMVIKLMPYTLPKVEPINFKEGEGGIFDWD